MLKLTGEDLNLINVWQVAVEKEKVALAPASKKRMTESRRYISNKMKAGEAVYGVNTGFGALSKVKVTNDKLSQLQKNLIRSHSSGVGEPFTPTETRAIMLLRANALARGHSGVRPEVVEKLLEFLNEDVIPIIPQQGSVGASGDLAPLAHLALSLIGEGKFWKAQRHSKKIEPLELQAKEGLSLINGCQVMTAVGLLNIFEARRLAWLCDVSGAMSLEAMMGSRSAFDLLISSVRKHPGESKTSKNLLKILGKNSKIGESHKNCDRIQDAYSLRCMPQVHGATKDALRNGLFVLEVEANSSTDNPLVFDKEDKILSCGNFHGEPVAFQLDFMGIAVAAMANISECRIEKLINPAMSGLPAFLIPDPGLNSGMMIVQVAAASLVSENKILTHPASVDSIPTSADKEDHVSMGTIAARKFGQIVRNSENVIAMELLCASQALDFLKPLVPAAGVLAAYDEIRKVIPFAKEDRVFANDIESIKNLIRDNSLLNSVTNAIGNLEL